MTNQKLAIDTIDREITEALRYNAHSLTSWLKWTGENSPEKGVAAFIKLLEMNNKLQELINGGATGTLDIQLIIEQKDKTVLEQFLNKEDENN